MKLKDLKKIADEINDLFDLDPEIIAEEEEVVVKKLVKAFGMFDENDSCDDFKTYPLIEQFAKDYPDDLDKKCLKGLAFIDIVPEEKTDDDNVNNTDGTETVEELTLAQEVEGAERLKDLKDIAKSNDEFKEIRGKLSAYKTADDLREAMQEVLNDKEAEPEPKSEKKKDKKKDKKEKEAEKEAKKEKKEEKSAAKTEKPAKEKGKAEQTKFGHRVGSQAGDIDAQFLANVNKKLPLSTIMENTGLRAARIKSHVNHLVNNKELTIAIKKADNDLIYKYTK